MTWLRRAEPTQPSYGRGMRTTVTTDDASLAQAARDLETADESLRKSFSGLDVTDVVPEVERSLSAIGIELPPDTVRAYAQHIADRADFQLTL